ncbi:MAG: ChbG/HpnK family deacetylase, partial [Burkholderiales bacterium]
AFVDGHQHVHALPVIRRIVIEETRHRNPRAWMRVPHASGPSPKAFVMRALTAGLTDYMSRGLATRCSVVEHAGGLALLALDLSPSLRAPLARHLLQGLRF